MNEQPSHSSTALHDCADAELPIVIRPKPLPLHRLEDLLEQDPELARLLATDALHLRALARAVLRGDAEASARFADVEALIGHLRSLL